ncbi:MAG: prepilin peptidase, partial [Beijerinckiaceae bacterium]
MFNAFMLGVVLPGLLAYACFSDLFSMTLSNRLCLTVVAAFGVFAAASGMPLAVVGWHLLAGLVVFAVVFGMFAAGWIGGGDAKFVVGIAMWMGFGQ